MVDFDGDEFLIFGVAALKEADSYGKTHTAFITKKVVTPKKEELKEKSIQKSRKCFSGLFLFGIELMDILISGYVYIFISMYSSLPQKDLSPVGTLI